MSKANVIMVNGEKGGIGKSMTLSWIMDNIIMSGREDIGIIETDNLHDIAEKYEKTGVVREAPLEAMEDESRLGGLMRLFETVSEMADEGKKLIFVNLPGRASLHVDPSAEIMKEAFEDEDVSLTALLVADSETHSKTFFENSMKNGLLSVADKKILVLNLVNHADPSTWPVMKSKAKPDAVFELPKFDPEVWKVIGKGEVKAPFFAFAQDKDLNAFTRNAIKRWIRTADGVAALVQEEADNE